MVYKFKNIIVYNIFLNSILSIILVQLFITISTDENFKTEIKMMRFQIFFLTWLSVNLFCFMRKLITSNKTLFRKYQISEKLTEVIANNNPCGIIILNKNGTLDYLNPTMKEILNYQDSLNADILWLDIVKKCNLDKLIQDSFNGKSSNLFNKDYTPYSTKKNKVLNIYVNPIVTKNNSKINQVMLMFNDITNEYMLKNEVTSITLSTLKALAKLVDARDHYTGMHSENVMRYVEVICDNLDIDQTEKEKILISASLHDIGKVGIDDYILKKEGKLTNEEYTKMKMHPVIGFGILSDINGFEEIATIIKHHHEWYNGCGYPDNLKGNKIPIGSQIISIADAFDAITTNRVYRKSLGYTKAINILEEERGRQFNSELVDIFINALEDTNIYIEADKNVV